MPWDLLIRGGDVVTPDGVRAETDVAVEDETIVEIAPGLSGAARETIGAAGLHVFPGVIDPHVHFNEPGRTDWEGFETGSSALAAGGGSCFFDMPLNSSPPTLDGESFDLKLAAAKANSRTDFALWGGLTPNNLDKMGELAERGVVGFKAFMSNSGIEDFIAADDCTLYRGMEVAAKLGLIVAVHAENDSITGGLAAAAVRDGRRGIVDYLRSRPVIAEVEAIERAAFFARETGCGLHIVHVSSRRGAWLAHISKMGLLVSFETCPHYLLLDETDMMRVGASAKCAPPLRPRDDVDYLRQHLDGPYVAFVASDHSPSPPSMKQGSDFFTIWGGIAGVQSTLPALLTLEPRLPLPVVGRFASSGAAARFGITGKGSIVNGRDADVTLVDVASEFTLTRDMLLDRHKLSPYVGHTFRGVVKRTIVRGHTVFRDGKIAAGDFRGKLVKPQRRNAGPS
jgi:allantoinase